VTDAAARVLYVNPMEYGTNAAVDALSHGLDGRLTELGLDLRVLTADFRTAGWEKAAGNAVRAGVAAGVAAIVIWVIEPSVPADAVAFARSQGVPVLCLERPTFEADACVVYPNFNHGVYMSEYLATLLPPGARVAVVGGPDVVDDIELLLGLQHGLKTSGLTQVNDPEDPRYKNTTDVASGGKLATTHLLSDFDDLDGLIPFNDETLLGAVEALQDAGRLGTITMVSRNGTPAAVELVRSGTHAGTWDIDTIGIGQQIGDLVGRAVLDGENLDGVCLASPIGRMITQERANSWVPWERRVTYRPLSDRLDGQGST